MIVGGASEFDKLSVPQTQVFEIVTENLVIQKVCTKFVPQVLPPEQNSYRKMSCQDLLYHANEYLEVLDNVMIGDET
ncbi:hypothetical protein TNCV_1724521 [Trichonephila clavipes]|nr:hypothetical protein TNCV_1724521 [Trichonephila clavipes]